MLKIQSRQFSKEHELYACIQCGKCTGGCPMAIKTNLNPRSLIYQLLLSGNGFDVEGLGELWDCTTCSTCSSRCPKQVNPMNMIISLRGVLVEGGRIHPNIKTALESTYRQGNPLTMAREDRGVWASDLEVATYTEQTEYLYFVGCTPSYDPQAQKSARALVNILNQAGVSYGILKTEESCCGSEVRRLGELGLFEMIIEENTEMYRALNVTKIFTTSPHCFNTFKNDYPSDDMQVQHYTQILAELIGNGALNFTGKVDKVVTYQDPCYLGKHNQVFDEPRFVLKSIPGVKLVDMDRSREKSLCCEGGGGRMWLEGTNPGTRLARMRVQEALETGAEILATACPFCLLTLEEAVQHEGAQEKLQVMDIAEIAAQAL
jgi:Fe-S oxidoreductase